MEVLNKISLNLEAIANNPWTMWTALATFLLGFIALVVAFIPSIRKWRNESQRLKGGIRIDLPSNGVYIIKNIWTKQIFIKKISQKIKTIEFPDDLGFYKGPYPEESEGNARINNTRIFNSNKIKLEPKFHEEIMKEINSNKYKVEQHNEMEIYPGEEIIFGKTWTNRLPFNMSGALGYRVETTIVFKSTVKGSRSNTKTFVHYYSMFVAPTDNWIRIK